MPPAYLAHDHMDRPEDFARDLAGGVAGKILHLTVDAWFDAPTREQYEATYYTEDGFLERGLAAAARALELADNPANRVRIVRSFGDLEAAREAGQLALILGNEGGKIVQDNLALLDAFFRLGLRHMQLNWAMRNRIGASQADEDEPERSGLTTFGVRVVERMNELGMIVDVSHSAPATIEDALQVSKKPILNSHSGSRDLAPKPQNLWDQQIRAIADGGGIIAVHFCSRLVLGVDDRQSTVDDVVRQIRCMADVGGIESVALGPDWILGYPGRDEPYLRNTKQEDITWTVGLESSAGLPDLVPAMEEDGFKASEIELVFGGNVLRLLRDVLPR
jgi:membrane dipeptidase